MWAPRGTRLSQSHQLTIVHLLSRYQKSTARKFAKPKICNLFFGINAEVEPRSLGRVQSPHVLASDDPLAPMVSLIPLPGASAVCRSRWSGWYACRRGSVPTRLHGIVNVSSLEGSVLPNKLGYRFQNFSPNGDGYGISGAFKQGVFKLLCEVSCKIRKARNLAQPVIFFLNANRPFQKSAPVSFAIQKDQMKSVSACAQNKGMLYECNSIPVKWEFLRWIFASTILGINKMAYRTQSP